MADFGYVAMAMAMAVSLYGLLVPHFAVRKNNWNLVLSVQYATIFNFVLLSIASMALVYGFVVSDFSIIYVWENSSTDMPMFYKVTAFWGGMDGSLLFWALVQALFAMVVAFRYHNLNREMQPYVLMILNGIMVFLLFLLLGWSNPLATQTLVPPEGRGLNPLLQNPAMVVHPPSLYLGYIGFSIPFAFAMAALIRNKVDNQWILTTRRWVLFSWYFLSLGLILGGQWAYEELGWGGYWAWDPVENAAFMPWLTGSAFLHSVMIQEKRDMLKIWNIVLIIITFALSILGTFITRSGVINSVHSFAQSEIGPAFLVYLAIVLVLGFVLLFWRIQHLESKHEMESVLCKENAFLAQNVLFLGIAFTVLLGTTFPMLAEAVRGTKLSIQAPFFNTVTAPMGYLLFFLMGIGTLIAWRRSSLESLRRNFLLPVLSATVLILVMVPLLTWKLEAFLICWIAIFVTSTIVIELFKTSRAKANQLSTNWFMGLYHVVARNKRRYGGLLIHLGVVFMFIGFAGRFYDVERNVTLYPNQPKQIEGYTLNLVKVDEFMVRNARHRAAIVEVYRDGKLIDTLKPAKAFYPTQPQPLTEVDFRRTPGEDLYLVFSGENEGGESVTLKVYVNPLVFWAWLALPIFTLGVGICMLYRPKTLAVRREVLEMQNKFKTSTI